MLYTEHIQDSCVALVYFKIQSFYLHSCKKSISNWVLGTVVCVYTIVSQLLWFIFLTHKNAEKQSYTLSKLTHMRHSVLWSAKSSIVVVRFNLTVRGFGDGPLGIPGDKSVVCLFFWILFQTPSECFCGVEDKRDCPRIAGNCAFLWRRGDATVIFKTDPGDETDTMVRAFCWISTIL